MPPRNATRIPYFSIAVSVLSYRTTGRKLLLSLLALACLALPGCQTSSSGNGSSVPKAISLEEAKAITARFKTTSYVPPSRSIDDIRRILRSPRRLPDNCAAVQSERRYELTLVLSRVGDVSMRAEAKAEVIRTIVERELQRGQFKDMESLLEEAIEKATTSGRYDRQITSRASFHILLAQIHQVTGNRERALRMLALAEQELGNVGSSFSLRDTALRSARTASAVKALTPIIRAYRSQLEGRHELAEANLRSAVQSRFHLGYALSLSKLQSKIGQNLLLQGRIAEAEYEIREAWRSEYEILEYTPHKLFSANLALPTRQLAEIFLLQNRLEDAKYLSEIAVNMYEVDCVAADSVGLAQAVHTLAQIQAARSDWNGILSRFEEMRKRLDGDTEAFDRLYGNNLEWLLAQAKTGSAAAAIRQLQAAVDSLADRDGEYEHAEYLGALAFTQFIAGDHGTARRNFATAIPVILKGQANGGTAVRDKVKSFRQQLILSGYMDTLLHTAGSAGSGNTADEAQAELFRIANISHLGRVQRAVTAAAARNAISDPALAELMRREQDAAQETESILNILSNLQLARSDQVRKENIGTLQDRFSALNRSRQTIMREISQRFPSYANLINPGPATLDEAAAVLQPGETMVVYHVSETGTLVWAIPKSGNPAFAHLPVPEQKIAEWVDSLRVALDPDVSTLGEIPVFDTALSHEVFRSLLLPVKDGWKGADRILLVPHGALGQLPFGLLVTAPYERPERSDGSVLFSSYKKVPWLIQQASIARYPSVNALLALRNTPLQQQLGSPMAGFADPQFRVDDGRAEDLKAARPQAQLASRGASKSGAAMATFRRRSVPDTRESASAKLAALPRLPDTSEEVQGIARALNANIEQSVFTGIRANERTVKTMTLTDRRVIVFATHGLIPGDLDGLAQPALALTAPTVAKVEGDGLLTMSEILNLKLNADWVVLSACNTGAAEGAGAEAVSGLGRAFFYAGARALLVSNWPVETTSATKLTTTLFEIQQGAARPSRAESLQRAMLTLIDDGGYRNGTGDMLFSYAHPLFWAPFTLVGDGGQKHHLN